MEDIIVVQDYVSEQDSANMITVGNFFSFGRFKISDIDGIVPPASVFGTPWLVYDKTWDHVNIDIPSGKRFKYTKKRWDSLKALSKKIDKFGTKLCAEVFKGNTEVTKSILIKCL